MSVDWARRALAGNSAGADVNLISAMSLVETLPAMRQREAAKSSVSSLSAYFGLPLTPVTVPAKLP